MRIYIIADSFLPFQSSATIQLRDLALEFYKNGHSSVVISPSHLIDGLYKHSIVDGVEVLNLKSARVKDISFSRRFISELVMPFNMRRTFRVAKSELGKAFADPDLVIWYSPSIFLSPFVKFIKNRFDIKAYLILRDFFPEWAVDLGVLKSNTLYFLLKIIEKKQYEIADVIGIQSKNNTSYFSNSSPHIKHKIKVLNNWLAPQNDGGCDFKVSGSKLAGRIIFVYAGNAGLAQGAEVFIDLAQKFNEDQDIGFIFVGRGNGFNQMRKASVSLDLKNTLFLDEVSHDEIPSLLKQCHVGLVSLSQAHKTHNIPGKFIMYMGIGIPVLAHINPGNDLEDYIYGYSVGEASTKDSSELLFLMAKKIINRINDRYSYGENCKSLYHDLFTSEQAITDILKAVGDL